MNGPFKITGLAQFLLDFSGLSLNFCVDVDVGVSNFCKVVSDYRSQSNINFLKGKKVSGSQRKMPV